MSNPGTLPFIFLALAVTRTFAAQAVPELLSRSWVQGPNLRQQSVWAMLLTRDGYLWIGTGKGLVRFDGVEFTAFNSSNMGGIKGDDISFRALWEDDRGVIWAGTDSHGVIVNDHGHFRTLQSAEGLPDLTVLRIDGDETGATWIFTMTGVCRWSNGRLEQMHPEREGDGASALVPHSNRRTVDFVKMGLWRRGANGLERFAYGHWSLFPTPPGDTRLLENAVRYIYEDHLRRIWYTTGTPTGRYFCVQEGKLEIIEGLPGPSLASYRDRSGFIWVNDRKGNAARWKDGRLYPLPELHSPYLLHVIERVDGTIWMGSGGTPLFEYRPRRIRSIATSGVPEIGSVLFRQRSGDTWAGGTNLLHGEHTEDGFVFLPFLPDHYMTKYFDPIDVLSEDREGHLLVGSRRFEGVEEVRGKTLVPYLGFGSIRGPVGTLLLTSSGNQWVGNKEGLYRVTKELDKEPAKLLSTSVFCLAERKPGVIWVGTRTGPVLFKGEQQQELRTQPVWSFGAVRSIDIDSEGVVWMSTQEHGVVRYEGGRLYTFGSGDGLPTDGIYSVTARGEDLWLRSDVGLIRVRKKSIERRMANRFSKLQVRLFDAVDGVPSASMKPLGNQGLLDLPGNLLWFASLGGIAEVIPPNLAAKPAALRPVMEEHAIDRTSLLPNDRVVLRPQNNLELHYTALGSERPEQIQFRYRLDGFDTDWVFAGTRRVAYYTHLPPGSYSFHVQAADNDGDFGTAPWASATIDVLTPFFLSWWMKTIVGCMAALTIVFILEARRRVERGHNRMRQAFTHRLIATQEGERKRIAHELHDSLGQHLVLIRTLAMLPANTPRAPGGDHLSKIAEQAAAAIHEVETISYDLRPYQLDRLGLTKAVKSLLHDLEMSHSLAVECSVENVDGFFPKDLEINFYRIVQEALSNVLKHAQATRLDVTIARTECSVRMTVADNGRGFAATAKVNKSLGLIGMQERAQALGGHAYIESSEGVGTKMLVEVTKV